jgi:hypothetical protein
MRMLKGIAIVVVSAVLLILSSIPGYSQEVVSEKQGDAGEFSGFGIKVSLGNYYFVKGAIAVFGTRWGEAAQTEEQLNEQVWDQLLLSYEAFRRNITVAQSQVEEEISKMLRDEKASFDWRQDKDAYAKWLKEKTGEPVELFENQLKHLLQLEMLRKEVMASIVPTMSEEEALEKFRDEYNTLELELVQFNDKNEAQAFYGKMQDAALWEAKVKEDPKFAMHPGFVALDFLIHMWKIPKQDLEKMMKMEVNAVYPPTPIYKGYGVFRILKKRPADDAEFPKLKESYLKKIEMIKKHEGLMKWLQQLKAEAKIRMYPLPQPKTKGPG